MKKGNIITLIWLGITILVVISIKIFSDTWNESKFTNYIKENIDDIKLLKKENDKLYFIMDTCRLFYYDDVTININDSSLNIIFWGDRSGTWVWEFKKDKLIDIDIPYLRYKNENVDEYVELLELINNKK